MSSRCSSVNQMKMEYYHYSLCQVCKKSSPELKRCASCKSMYYCSKEHQKQDWGKHKEICKVIRKTNRILTHQLGCTAEEFNHFKHSGGLLWKYELPRPLKLCEHQIWMFPKVCSICYSHEAGITCKECLSVSYCNEEHHEQHKEGHLKYCKDFKLSLLIMQNGYNERDLPNWRTIKINSEIENLPENMDKIMELLYIKPKDDLSKRHTDYINFSDSFAPAVNIIYALEKSGFVQNRCANKHKLSIHIVGFDLYELSLNWSLIFEFLLHWITNLKTIKLFFAGPDLSDDQCILTECYSKKFCDSCLSRSIRVIAMKIPEVYHQAITHFDKPNIVVAFNSGLHEFRNTEKDTWKSSLPHLIKHREVPLLLTAYTEDEIKKDLARFPADKIRYLLESQKNPYSDKKPMRNWEEGDEPVYYQNGYISVITKS